MQLLITVGSVGATSPILAQETSLLGVRVQNWVAAVVVLFAALASFVVMKRIQRNLVQRLAIRNYTADMIRRALMAVVGVVALFYIFGLLELEIGPLVGGLGISGLIAAIALQPVIGNFMGSVLLHGTSAFRPGDEIESNGVAGTVIDISHRTVHLRDFDGNSVYIPNLRVLDSNLINLTADDPRRSLLQVQVAYGTDLRLTQQVLKDAVSAIDGVVSHPPVEVLARGFADSGVDIEVQVWHGAEEIVARRTASEAAIVIHETLAANDITIPYPHLVVKGDLPQPAQFDVDLVEGDSVEGEGRAVEDLDEPV